MLLKRYLLPQIENVLPAQKVTLLVGARRTGKTELLKTIFNRHKETSLFLNGEDADTEAVLENRSVSNYQKLLNGKKLLLIDEAQYIKDISLKAKLMIDNIKPLHIVLTGSSSFDLIQSGNPLVGRSETFFMYPLSQVEWQQTENLLETRQNLEERLIYGSYPELVNFQSKQKKEDYLRELVSTYLLKDILQFENIRNANKINDMLKLMALQTGSEVSTEKLGKQLSMSKNTVEKYLDLLSKVYVVYQLNGFSRNLRKEIVKSKKWYFSDNGIRNALINNFSPLALRNDTGKLWEQYFINERQKYLHSRRQTPDHYFWRTYDQQEIDLIEVSNENILAFECKWKKSNVKAPGAFKRAYPGATFHVINQNNYLDWIT